MTQQPVDPERPREPEASDRPGGYSGEAYDRDRERAEGARAADPLPPEAAGDADLPPDDGARAGVDPATGAVSGAGMGAGGGQPGEDFSSDAATGSGYALTGGEGGDHRPGPLGPKNDKAGYL